MRFMRKNFQRTREIWYFPSSTCRDSLIREQTLPMQCVKLLKEDEEPVIRTATTYVITAPLTLAQEDAIRHFCINPVDSRQAEEDQAKDSGN